MIVNFLFNLDNIYKMKKEIILIQEIKRKITFYIGKNKNENFEVIDNACNDDLWFHAKNISSCHVVCELPDDINKKELSYIIKVGALLCKNNTNKLISLKNVEIIYTKIENVTKTNIPGCVTTENTKTVIC